MILITSVAIDKRASEALRKQADHFEPRVAGEVFALFYSPSFINRDGTTVAGFAPGYMVGSQSPVGLGDHWAKVRLPDGLEFLFMPKFRPDNRPIVIDLISDVFVIFSIRPAL
jgi:hypothetical protein